MLRIAGPAQLIPALGEVLRIAVSVPKLERLVGVVRVAWSFAYSHYVSANSPRNSPSAGSSPERSPTTDAEAPLGRRHVGCHVSDGAKEMPGLGEFEPLLRQWALDLRRDPLRSRDPRRPRRDA